MTDPTAAVIWAIIASVFLSCGVFSCLLAHSEKIAVAGALAWMFLALAVGFGLLASLRTGWGILPLSHLKVIERTAFAIAAVNGVLSLWILANASERVRKWGRQSEHPIKGLL